MKDTRQNIKVDEPVLRVLQRMKAEHRGVSYSWLLLHLAVEHDHAQDLRATLKSKGKARGRDLRKVGELVRIPELEAEAEGMSKEEWERKHGTPEENAKILDVLGIPPGVAVPYVPVRFGAGRPKGAKDSKPRKKRVKQG